MDTKRRRRSLSKRILQFTLIIGVTTLLVATVVSGAASSRVTTRFVNAHELVTLQAAEDSLEAHLSLANDALSRTTRAAMVPDKALRRQALEAAFNSSADSLEALVISDRGGRTLAYVPGEEPIEVPHEAIAGALAGEQAWIADTRGGQLTVYVSRAVDGPRGEQLVVTAALSHGAFDAIVGAASAQTRSGSALLIDRSAQRVLARSGKPIDTAKLHWPTSGAPTGRAWLLDADGRRRSGPYTSVDGIPGLDWRLVVLEPEDLLVLSWLEVAWPTMLVMIIGGSVALVFAWLVSRRLVSPLRELEEVALRAAKGAYVKPIEVTGDDEIAGVAEAFNAVSLRLNALHDLSQLLASGSQLDQVLDGILAATGHIVGPGVTAVYLLNDAGTDLVPAAVKGVAHTGATPVPATGDGWLAGVLRSTEPSTSASSPEELEAGLPGLLLEGAKTAIAAPLVVGNESLGVVVAVPHADRIFSEAEIEMLRTFSAQAGVAVKNTRLFADEAGSRRAAEALRSIAETLVRPVTVTEALSQTELELQGLIGARWVRIAPVEREVVGLRGPRHPGELELVGIAQRVLGGRNAPAPVTLTKKDDPGVAQLLANVGGDQLFISPVALASDHGAVLGVAIDSGTLSPADEVVLAAACDEISLAMENAHFYDRAVSRAENLERIFRISQVVSSSLQVNVVLNRVLDVVQRIFSSDAVVLMTYDSSRRRISTDMARGRVSPAMLELEVKPGEDVPGYVFATSEPANVSDLHEGTGGGGVSGEAVSRGLHSLLAVPLVARERSIGVVMVFSADVGAFDKEDEKLLSTFAAQAALAIDTARVYSREHEVSRILQDSILPEKLPEYPEMETGTNYVAAASPASEIGGDYYDVVRGPDGRIFLAIADVCGKGIVAATKTSMIKYSVRALVTAGLGPSQIVGNVNGIVCESGVPGDIVTLFVGALDSRTGTLAWANGGHPPALLRDSSGRVSKLGATGPLLGAVADIEYEEQVTPVSAGDTLLLYTDGVTEARSGNRLFGEERLRRTLDAPGSATEVADRVLEAVRRYVRGDLRDDIAILAVRFREPPSAATDEERDA